MKLIYDKTGAEVQLGDEVKIDGQVAEVHFFRRPHKPASSGLVTVYYPGVGSIEYYVGVIGATWIDREDRQ